MTIQMHTPPQQHTRPAERSAQPATNLPRSPTLLSSGKLIYPPYVLAPNTDPIKAFSLGHASEVQASMVEGIIAWNHLLIELGIHS